MPITHLVLDVWDTILRTNLKYREAREAAISRSILSQVSDFANEIDVKRAFASTKELLDGYEWKTGISIPYDFKHMVLSKAMHVPWASSSVHWPLMFNELFLANSPVLIHPKIVGFLNHWVSQGNTWSILSNTHFIQGVVMREALKKEGIDLNTASCTYFSDEGKYCKPHKSAFEGANPFRNLPSEIMMVGDNKLLDLDPAVNLGWNVHLIDGVMSWDELFNKLNYK